jgi:hypothetical protein
LRGHVEKPTNCYLPTAGLGTALDVTMTTPRVSNHYPRRGERIAPLTLREFLLEPVPERILASRVRETQHTGEGQQPETSLVRSTHPTGDGPLRLCDLDESVWDRFPAEVVLELARLVVDRMAGYHARKVFQYRHFPRPPAGTRLEDLRLENRTRRCLVREGFEENPAALGDHSIGEIMSLRAFGPRCLVDLLAALESPRLRSAAEWQSGAGQSPLSEELTAAARRLAAIPEARLIRRDDARFARLIESLDVEARTAADAAKRLQARILDPPDLPYAVEQLRLLIARIEEMPRLTVEAELIGIFAATPVERNREILIGYYGWRDGRPHTLTEIGARFRVTRERVRQICAKLTRRPKGAPPPLAPATDRALQLVESRLPAAADAIEAELQREGLTAVGLQLEALAAAAELLERPVRFRVVGVDARRLAVTPEQAEAVPAIADLARKEIYFHGLSTVRQIERLAAEKHTARAKPPLVAATLPLVDGFAWLDERGGWFRLRSIEKHGLPKTVEKILAVAGEVTFAQMRAAMGRNRRLWKDPPPESVLCEFCRQTPGVRVEGNRVAADPPRDWRQVLAGVERQLVEVLTEHGPIMDRGALEDLCVSGGMNRFSFHAFVSWSPVIEQVGHSLYGLLGAKAAPRTLDALAASRRAKRALHRVLDSHGTTADGRIWLRYRLSKAASTYAVITVPAALKETVCGRFTLLSPEGDPVGTLATKDGRAWGLGAFLRRQHARIDDHVVLTLDLAARTATVSWGDAPE